MDKKSIILFAEYDSSGGTREFLKQFILLNNNLNIITHVISDSYDIDMFDFFKQKNINFTLIKKRSSLFYRPYFSLIYEYFYHRPIIKKIKHDLIISSVGTAGINFFHFFNRSKFLYILHSVPKKNGLKSSLHFYIPRFFQSNQKQFFVVSEYLKINLSILWKINLNNIKVIYNSYRFEKSNVEMSNYNKITLLTIGHLINYKNPNLWLDIAIYFTSKFANVKFIWVGDGPLFESLINRVPQNSNIYFVGKSYEVEKFYKDCDIYLNFSDMESLGMGVVDAISCGIPCVVRQVGGLTEIIEHELNGFTFTDNEDAKFYIDKLICNAELRKKMGNNSLIYKKKYFSPITQLNEIKRFYQSILNTDL